MEAAGGLTRVMACNMIQLHEAKGPRTAVAVRLTEMAAVRTVVNPTGAATTSNKWTWLKAAEQNSSAVLHLENNSGCSADHPALTPCRLLLHQPIERW